MVEKLEKLNIKMSEIIFVLCSYFMYFFVFSALVDLYM